MIKLLMPLVQNRPAVAGSSMIPTAMSVPSAWKPPTRLSTTSTRKVKWVSALSLLTERRNWGSTHSKTNGRSNKARVSKEKLVMEHSNINVVSSSASTIPNSTRIRSMLLPRIETISTPSARAIRENAARLESSRS